jgi:PGF-CTERM protein
MKPYMAIAVLVVLLGVVLAAGCTSPQSQPGYASVRSVDLAIPDGQPPSNVTEVVVSPYLDAMYAALNNVELQVSVKDYGTDIVVAEKTVPIGNLTPGKTEKESVSLLLENGRKYDVWVTVWQGGRMQEKGSVDVYLPDRTITERRLAYSQLTITAIDVMTPDLEADPITLDIITDITNSGQSPSGVLTMEIKLINLQTGITAIRESRPLGTITASTTAEKKVSVMVPNGYDYTVSIRLIEDGTPFASSAGRITLAPPPQVVIAGGQSGVVLDSALSNKGGSSFGLPTPTPVPTGSYPSSAQVGQFRVQSSGAPVPSPVPGFEAVLAVAGMLGAAFVLARRRG